MRSTEELVGREVFQEALTVELWVMVAPPKPYIPRLWLYRQPQEEQLCFLSVQSQVTN